VTKNRLWIASPYIGSWDAVRRVLGKRWWELLPDIRSGSLRI
jgi:hypothetical protein